MTPVGLDPAAPQSRVKHSTTETLRSLLAVDILVSFNIETRVGVIVICNHDYL